MKINQYCSVCKKHLDMEVVPTDDGGDDGVIWLQCPECRGFLPKFTGESTPEKSDDSQTIADPATPATADADEPDAAVKLADPSEAAASAEEPEAPVAGSRPKKESPPAEPAEPVDEYRAQLAAADPSGAQPYRPTESYQVGDVVHHLAWDDIGVVVAKEVLPGGRRVVKAFFETVGVVRLIEQAADGT